MLCLKCKSPNPFLFCLFFICLDIKVLSLPKNLNFLCAKLDAAYFKSETPMWHSCFKTVKFVMQGEIKTGYEYLSVRYSILPADKIKAQMKLKKL